MVVAEYTCTDRRLCVAVDMQGYGGRAGARHTEIQQNLVALLGRATRRAGLDPDTWEIQRSGDGVFAVLPADQPEGRIVDDFVRELAAELRRVNEGRKEEWCIRLRLAVHYGPAWPAANGFAGSGPVAVGRLLNCEPLRRALAAGGKAFLAVVLSRQVYEDTVVAAHTSLEPADFLAVRVVSKEFDQLGWLRVPGLSPAELKGTLEAHLPAPGHHGDAPVGRGGGDQQSATADREGTVQQAGRDLTRYGGGEGPTYVNHTTFQEGVTVENGVIGFSFGGQHG